MAMCGKVLGEGLSARYPVQDEAGRLFEIRGQGRVKKKNRGENSVAVELHLFMNYRCRNPFALPFAWSNNRSPNPFFSAGGASAGGGGG